jgi:hypothetical protein
MGQPIHLDKLYDDVLLVVFSFVVDFKLSVARDISLWPILEPCNLGTGRMISTIKSLSLVNKHFRSLALHFVFQSVKVDGDWHRALRCFDTLSKNIYLYPHVRYGRARIQLSVVRSVQYTKPSSQDSQTCYSTKIRQPDSPPTAYFLRQQITRDPA